MDLLERMLGHDRWATAQYLQTCRNLGDDQLDQEFDIGHKTLRATFDHMIFNVDAWTAMMAGTPVADIKRDGLSVAELAERHECSYDTFASVARQMHDDARLDGTFIDDSDYPQSNGGTILHVVLHNAQHRAEILHIFRRLGVSDPLEGDPQEWEHRTGRL